MKKKWKNEKWKKLKRRKIKKKIVQYIFITKLCFPLSPSPHSHLLLSPPPSIPTPTILFPSVSLWLHSSQSHTPPINSKSQHLPSHLIPSPLPTSTPYPSHIICSINIPSLSISPSLIPPIFDSPQLHTSHPTALSTVFPNLIFHF